MDPMKLIPGTRVEIEGFGEGTIVDLVGDQIEVAVSELETVLVGPEQVINLS